MSLDDFLHIFLHNYLMYNNDNNNNKLINNMPDVSICIYINYIIYNMNHIGIISIFCCV